LKIQSVIGLVKNSFKNLLAILSKNKMNLRETRLQIFGLAMIFYVVVTLGFSSFFNLLSVEAKKNVANPVMALEFVRKAGEVDEIVKGNIEARKGLKTFLILDSFAFVPLYFAFLLIMSLFLSQSNFEWARTAAIFVVFLAIIAAAADWTENYYSYQALDTVFSNPEEPVSVVFWAAQVKWVMLFIAIGTLSAIFWRGSWWNITALLLLSSSLTGLAGLIFYRPLITLALIIQLLIILVVGIVLMFPTCRSSFLQNH
jgi:hypothetical protein